MITASPLQRSGFAAIQRSRFTELDSSSPSKRYFTLTGSFPRVLRSASSAAR